VRSSSNLLCEERDEDDLPTGTLLIGAPMPPSFFAPGQHVAADNLPTLLGTISLRCESTEREVLYSLRIHQSVAHTDAQSVFVELFYFDASGKQRSHKQRVQATGAVIRVQLSR
jgi:hypothetical protein